MVVSLEAKSAIGAGQEVTFINDVFVSMSEPEALETVSVTVYVPGVE